MRCSAKIFLVILGSISVAVAALVTGASLASPPHCTVPLTTLSSANSSDLCPGSPGSPGYGIAGDIFAVLSIAVGLGMVTRIGKAGALRRSAGPPPQ